MLCNKALDLGDRYHIRPNQKQSETLGETINQKPEQTQREGGLHRTSWTPTEQRLCSRCTQQEVETN